MAFLFLHALPGQAQSNSLLEEKDLPVGVVGGFGYACKDVLARMGKEYGITFSRFMSTPTEGLVEYHAL